MSVNYADIISKKDEEIAALKRTVAEQQSQLLKITGAPLITELELPEGFAERTFSDMTNEVSSMGQAKKIKTIELSEVDMDHFNDVDVMERFIVVQSAHRENNRSNEDLEKMSTGKLSKSSSSRATEVQNSLRVFFGFCQRMFGKADFRHLLDERVVAAFPRWYKQMGRQPSSTTNHLKNLKAFMKFLAGQQVFFNYITKITSVVETIKPLQSVFSKPANSAKYTLTDEKMRLLGMWLTEPEFLVLNKLVCDFLFQKFKEDEDFVREKKDDTTLSRANVALIMDHVYLLGLMYLGGQRNQFVASLSTKNVIFEGSLTKYLKTHEKVNRQKVDYFKFPLAFSVMIRVWMTRYLPLVRGKDVEACWVSSTGSAISHGKMGERVSPIVALYFPGRHITPIYFRRAIVTFIKGKSFGTDAQGVDSFFKEKLADAPCRRQPPDPRHGERLGGAPCEALADLIRTLADDYDQKAQDYRKDALEIVGHRFVKPNEPEFDVKFKDGGDKVLNWTEMSPLLHLVDVYWAKIGGPKAKVQKPKLPSKWGIKPRKSAKAKVEEAEVEVEVEAKKTKAKEKRPAVHERDEDEQEDFGLDPVSVSEVEAASSEEENAAVDLLTLANDSTVAGMNSKGAAPADPSPSTPAVAVKEGSIPKAAVAKKRQSTPAGAKKKGSTPTVTKKKGSTPSTTEKRASTPPKPTVPDASETNSSVHGKTETPDVVDFRLPKTPSKPRPSPSLETIAQRSEPSKVSSLDLPFEESSDPEFLSESAPSTPVATPHKKTHMSIMDYFSKPKNAPATTSIFRMKLPSVGKRKLSFDDDDDDERPKKKAKT